MSAGETCTLGPEIRSAQHRILTGSCSWTDRTLVQDSDWYPKRTMSAADRLGFYASRFPLTEIDSTYYAPPAAEQARLWAERTPPGFRFDVKAYSLLTGHPTRPQSLWPDLRERLRPDSAGKRNLYAKHLDPEALEEAWRRFATALAPLREADRLGAVLFQYPPWFVPRRANRDELAALPERLPGLRICVELRSARWLAEPADRDRTLGLLREHGLVHVAVDAPPGSGLPRLLEITDPELFVVRFHGRNDETWNARTATAAERFDYLYSDRELDELARELAEPVQAARESHLLMNNCHRDYSVRGADGLRERLAALVGA